jgi:hypothetical protein
MKRLERIKEVAGIWYWRAVEKVTRIASPIAHCMSVKLLSFSAYCDHWAIHANQLKK